MTGLKFLQACGALIVIASALVRRSSATGDNALQLPTGEEALRRKPDCHGIGAVCYDPRFVGGDGTPFYFHGRKDESFCIVSDEHVHVNAHFIGMRPEGRPQDVTWVQSLAILFGSSHTLSIFAKRVGVWFDDMDQLAVSFDGEVVLLPELEGSLWMSPTQTIMIERTANTNNLHVVIDRLMEVALEAVPVAEEDSDEHGYGITGEDCFAHLRIQFTFFRLSGDVDGVLGQTYRPDFAGPARVAPSRFRASSLLSPDCPAGRGSFAS